MNGFSKNSVFALFAALRLGSKTKKNLVTVPYSGLNALLLLKFYEKGLLSTYILNSTAGTFSVYLKCDHIGAGLLESLYWYSVPSRLVFLRHGDLRKLDRSFWYLLFTEKGLFFSDDLDNLHCGGVLLCKFLR